MSGAASNKSGLVATTSISWWSIHFSADVACPARTPPRPRPTTCTLRWDRSPRSRARAPARPRAEAQFAASPPAPPQSWSSELARIRGGSRHIAEDVSRRRALSLAAATAFAFAAPSPSRAAYETQTAPSSAASAPSAPASNDLTLYKRSFRERFETSISSGTHDYSFKYPKDTWKPDIVSLNDGKLYGVDLRFSSPGEGKLCTHVLPFVGDESLKDVGPPEAALDRFVELIGAFWNENGFGVPGGNAGTLESTRVVVKDGVTYYEYETVKPHNLISAAVTDGQLYVINASAGNERQWQQGEANLRGIVGSFYVPP